MLRSVRASLLALALCACATAQPPATVTGAQLAGTSWRQTDPATPAAQTPTIAFGADGRASGFAGCNQWFASVSSTEGGNLRFGAIGATRRMCEPAAMEVERAFLAGLARTLAANNDSPTTLRLIGDEADQIAVFEAWTPPAR